LRAGITIDLGVDEVVVVGLTTNTPLSQTSFFPDLIHVKVLLEATDVTPAVEQVPPALTAALTGTKGMVKKRESIDNKAISLLFILTP
jgi:hypothetical protein